MKNVVKEFYVGKSEEDSTISLTFVVKDDKKLCLEINRDIAINMIENLHRSLDIYGLHHQKTLN